MKQKNITQLIYLMKFTAGQLLLVALMMNLAFASDLKGQKAVNVFKMDLEIQVENQSIAEVFELIESKTNYKFSFDKRVLKGKPRVSLQENNIGDALTAISRQARLNFKQVNTVIGVSEVKTKDPIQPVEVILADKSISGKVTDAENGEPLAGVNVVVSGSSIGTITDVEGEFTLEVPETAVALTFSYVGYEVQEVEIGSRSVIDVRLAVDLTALEEIVVVGYGTQIERNITGSMSKVSSNDLQHFQVGSFTEALVGVIPGVQINQITGDPGAAPSIRIRGVGSITAGNEPLYVIDGFPLDREALSNFNMNDIESITVLKDASATSIYGSRGSNGVVLITTKRGEKGEAKIDFEMYYGIQEVTKKLDVLSPEEFVQFSIDAKNNAWQYLGNDPNDPNENRPPFYQVSPYYFDTESWVRHTWFDEIFRTAPIQNYQLSVSGGSESIRYMLSGSFFDQDGIIQNSNFKRYSIRSNIDADLTERLNLNLSLAASKIDNKRVRDEGQFNQGVVGSAINLPGFFDTQNEDGSYPDFWGFGYGVSSVRNPMAFINEYDDQRDQFRILGNIAMNYQIVNGLSFKTYLGIDFQEIKDNSFQNSFRYDVLAHDDHVNGIVEAQGSHASTNDFNWLWENTLHYSFSLDGGHKFDALGGITSQKSDVENSFINATNFPDNLVPTLNAGQVTSAGTSITQWSMISYLARLNYSYKGRYFATATVRRDGSSRFGRNNKWGYFPSASVGWILSEESIFRNLSFISLLKLRSSYGVAGNNSIPNYGSIGLLAYSDYVINNTIVPGLVPSTLSNEDLSWETSKQFDFGLDVALFKDKIQITTDFYRRINDNLLLEVPVPSILGVTNAFQNIGKVRNQGFEFQLSSYNLSGKLSWRSNLNFSFNRNKVLALGPSGDPIRSRSNQISNITQVGRPIGDFYGYVFEGVYNTMEEINNRPSLSTDRPGDPIVRDVNNDGVINVEDRTVLGNYQPDFQYGFENNFTFANFDFSFIIQGVQGAKIMNLGMRQSMSMSGRTNNLGLARERWRSPEEPGNGRVFSASADIRGVRRNPSTFYMEDGSYLRIRNITIGYNFDTQFINKIGVEKARVYISSQNPFTFTKYPGFNPEVSSYHNALTPGIDYFNYPIARTITLGFNLSL